MTIPSISLFRLELDGIGDVGESNALVEIEEVEEEEGSVCWERSRVSVAFVLSAMDSVRSGKDECWSRLIWEERLL